MTRSLPALGAVGGLLGGMVMAMWSMIVMWLTGEGLWTPLNLIAHTFWDGALRQMPPSAAGPWSSAPPST